MQFEGLIVYILTMSLTTLGTWSLGVYLGFFRERTRIHYLFAVVMFLVGLWAFGVMLQGIAAGIAQNLKWAFIFHKLGYTGLSFFPPCLLLLAFSFGGEEGFFKNRWLPLLFLVPSGLLVLAMLTNEWHHTYYTYVYLDNTGVFFVLMYRRGPVALVNLMVSYILVGIAAFYTLIIYIKAYREQEDLFSRQVGLILLGFLIPLVMGILHESLKLVLDLRPIGVLMGVLIIHLAFVKSKFIDVSPIARDYVIANLNDGFLVVNSKLELVDLNQRAKNYLFQGGQVNIGANLCNQLEQWQPHLQETGAVQLQQFENGILEIIEGKKAVKKVELTIPQNDEVSLTLEVMFSPVRIGKRVYVVGMLRDITTRVDLEKRRADFIATTSHELRTPLTAISACLELLEGRLGEYNPEKRDKCFEIMGRNIRRLKRLIEGVSTLGRIERGILRLEKEEINFIKFLSEVMEPYKIRLRSQLEIHDYQETISAFIEADPGRLLQVLDNLMDNAIKNSPKGQRRIVVWSEVLPEFVKICITDNGAGIAPEDLTRIFEPFMSISTEYSVGGTGIGLHLSRMIVEAHGGTLTAQSEGLGQGATFIIELPRRQPSELQ